MCSVIKLRPQFYVHILDRNTNVTSLILGPQTHTCFDHEKVVFGPEQMVVIPPLHYVCIENPAKRDAEGKVITDEHGQVVLRFSEKEFRFAHENNSPFPLYPGEVFDNKFRPLLVVEVGQALRIRALVDFESNEIRKEKGEKGEKIFRHAGDMWLFEGPGMYYPSINEEIIETVKEYVLQKGQALKMLALRDCVDKKYGKERHTGDLWLMQEPGSYLPGPYEKVETVQDAMIVTEKIAFHLRASRDHDDIFGNERKQGDEWLITSDLCSTYQLDVYEEVLGKRNLIILTNREYTVLENPIGENGKADLGTKKIIKGPKRFFLQPPYERQIGEISSVIVLQYNQAIYLKAKESFFDGALNRNRRPGDLWLHRGPGEYWPVLEADIIARKTALVEISSYCIYEPSTVILTFLALFFALIYYFIYC